MRVTAASGRLSGLVSPPPPGTPWTSAALRGLAALVLLLLTAGHWGPAYLGLALPLYTTVLQLLPHGWESITTTLVVDGTETMVQARFVTVTGFEFAGRWIPPGGAVTASTLQGHALQHPVILLTLWAAWPVTHCWRRLAALLPALAALLVVEAVDLPLVLAGAMQDIMLVNLAPQRLATNPYVWLMNVMNTGGRLALSLAAGAAAMAVVTGRTRTVGRKA